MVESQEAVRVVEEDDIRPPPHYTPDGPQQVITKDTARQGPLGGRVLLVLAGSLVLIGVAWLAIAMATGHGL
jgi:hypothetical protein